jgi:hypothetical protein
MSLAEEIAAASNVDLPLPATPRTTSAPPQDRRAAFSSSVTAARSESRPTSINAPYLRAAANPGEITGATR